MPPEATATPDDTSSPAVETPSPAVEVPTETPAPEPVQTTPEQAPAPVEAVPAPETAQIPPNEPMATESEPFDSAQDKPTHAPEPPSAAASAPAPAIVQTGILHNAPSVAKAMEGARELLGKARVAMQDRKRKKRDKIMLVLTTKNKVTNDDVEKLLHVSDATATRYLSALEKEGKIRQVGTTGHGVVYQKI